MIAVTLRVMSNTKSFQLGIAVAVFASALLGAGCIPSDDEGDPVVGGGGTGGAPGGTGAGDIGGQGGEGGEGGAPDGGSGGGPAGSGGTPEVGGTGGEPTGGTGGFPTGGTGGESGGGGISGDCTQDSTIIAGAANRILLKGTVVTPDTVYVGQVLVEGDTIKCVKPGTDCENEPAASGATVIDTHNHILFDIFNDDHWVPVIGTACNAASDCISAHSYCTTAKCDCVNKVCKYKNHNNWTSEDEYGCMLDYKQCLENASQGKPPWCSKDSINSASNVRCEMNKWGEIKGLIAGTTSIVGLPGTSSPCFKSLTRTITNTPSHSGSGKANEVLAPLGHKIQTSATVPSASIQGVCNNFSSGSTQAYLVHCGEGVDEAARKEFDTLFTRDSGCLQGVGKANEPVVNNLAGVAITHGTAFTQNEYDKMYAWGVKLTWSPASNVALYGKTNDLDLAIAAGLTISLAPDWSMGGSDNMLDELRFARSWAASHYTNKLTAKDVFMMATVNAAAVLVQSNTIGRLMPGFKADLFVIGGNTSAPYDAILSATPKQVRLVMVGGKVLYGDHQLKDSGPKLPGCETLDVCGCSKFICVAEASSSDKLDQTLTEIRNALTSAVQGLDSVNPLPASSCSPGCKSNESCYTNTLTGSGTKCSPKCKHSFAPIAPLFTCQ